MTNPFWKTVPLQDMSAAQWEALCDGCAKCCLIKLQDQDTQDIVFTDVVCHLLDTQTRQCTKYDQRCTLVPTCVKLTPENLDDIAFMPDSCAYKLVADGHDLPSWHPLVTGDRDSVRAADMSVTGRVVTEADFDADFDGDFEDRVVDWPLKTKA